MKVNIGLGYLVDILIVEYTWPPQHSTEVFVQIVGTPKQSSLALFLDTFHKWIRHLGL